MTDLASCREAFEVWLKEEVRKNGGVGFEAALRHWAWAGWQAAWNTRANSDASSTNPQEISSKLVGEAEGGEAVAYLNTRYKTLFHAAEIGCTERADELIATGELVRLYTHPRDTTAEVERDAWGIASHVRAELDKQSCPDHWMRIAVEAVVKHLESSTPLTTSAEVEKDAERLQFLLDESCVMQKIGDAYWLWWPKTEDVQEGHYDSAREAIDAALAAMRGEVGNG